MKLRNWGLIIIGIGAIAYTEILLNEHFRETKDWFFYNDDWLSLAVLTILIMVIIGIMKWVLHWELHTIDKKPRRR